MSSAPNKLIPSASTFTIRKACNASLVGYFVCVSMDRRGSSLVYYVAGRTLIPMQNRNQTSCVVRPAVKGFLIPNSQLSNALARDAAGVARPSYNLLVDIAHLSLASHHDKIQHVLFYLLRHTSFLPPRSTPCQSLEPICLS